MSADRIDSRARQDVAQEDVGRGGVNRPDSIRAIRQAMMGEATEDAQQILHNAESEAESLRQQAELRAKTDRETILRRARRKAESVRTHSEAGALLEAQALRLRRREGLLDRVFASIEVRLGTIPRRSDYSEIAERLVRQALERLAADEVVVRVDTRTRAVLTDDVLAQLAQDFGVHIHTTKLLAEGTGAVLETADGHRAYDNTLETRLARTWGSLRTPVYQVLAGHSE